MVEKMVEKIVKVAELLNSSNRICILTGAGISAESGVPTFRGEGGLWREYSYEELATPTAFKRDPKLVWEWYGYRQGHVGKCDPNPAHKTLVQIEKAFEDFLLITQNVDGLHRRAGSRKILELHGNIFRARCIVDEEKVIDFTLGDEVPPHCPDCGEMLRPHIVWFGESLDREGIEKAFNAAAGSELFIVIGTSGLVQPAASLPFVAMEAGASVVEINLKPTPLTSYADVSIQGKAGEVLPLVWKKFEEIRG